MSNMNIYTIAGIIAAAISYFLIQKGAVTNAQKNRTQIENKLDTVTNKAIKSIEETADSTKSRITNSADGIIKDLEQKANTLAQNINTLSYQAKQATQEIKEDVESRTKKTQSVVVDQSGITRDKIDEAKKETIDEVTKINPDGKGFNYLVGKYQDLIKDNSHDNWTEWHKTKKHIAETHLKQQIENLNNSEKGRFINFLFKTGLIGDQHSFTKYRRQEKGDLEKVYSEYWVYIPVNLAYLDFNDTVFEESFWVTGSFMSFMQLNGIEAKRTFNVQNSFLQVSSFRGAKLSEAQFYNCNLSGTFWANANLVNADFKGSNLRGANFSTWNYKDRDLFITDNAANLKGVNFSRADLTNALISADQLKSAKSLEGAIMPNGEKYDESKPIEEQVNKLKLITLRK